MKCKKMFIFVILISFFLFLTNFLIVKAFWLGINNPTNEKSNNQIEIGSAKNIKTRIGLSNLENNQNKILLPKNTENIQKFEYKNDKEYVNEITFKKRIIWKENTTPYIVNDEYKKILKVSVNTYLKNIPQSPQIPLDEVYKLFKVEITGNNQEIKLNDPNGVVCEFKFYYNSYNQDEEYDKNKKLYDILYLNDIIIEIVFEVVYA